MDREIVARHTRAWIETTTTMPPPRTRIVARHTRAWIETEFIKVGRRNNLEIYRFCLESGFLPRHGKELLQKLWEDGRIQTVDLKVRGAARKGAFYLSWEQYKTSQPRISFECRGQQ